MRRQEVLGVSDPSRSFYTSIGVFVGCGRSGVHAKIHVDHFWRVCKRASVMISFASVLYLRLWAGTWGKVLYAIEELNGCKAQHLLSSFLYHFKIHAKYDGLILRRK